jgi:hypothetical protein
MASVWFGTSRVPTHRHRVISTALSQVPVNWRRLPTLSSAEVHGAQQDARLHPIAVESMAAISKNGLAFLMELGVRVMTVTKERLSFEFLMHMVSVAIQRGNDACILHQTSMVFFFINNCCCFPYMIIGRSMVTWRPTS